MATISLSLGPTLKCGNAFVKATVTYSEDVEDPERDSPSVFARTRQLYLVAFLEEIDLVRRLDGREPAAARRIVRKMLEENGGNSGGKKARKKRAKKGAKKDG